MKKTIFLLILVLNILPEIKSQNEESLPFFDLKISEYKEPVKDRLNGFGWFLDYQGSLISLVKALLNEAPARIKIKNGVEKYINVQCDNKSDKVSHRKQMLDVLKMHYNFSIKDAYDSVDVIDVSVFSDSLLFATKSRIYFDAELQIKNMNFMKDLDSISEKRRNDSLKPYYDRDYQEYLIKLRDSVDIAGDELCAPFYELQDKTNFIFNCKRVNEGGQYASDGGFYTKYQYSFWLSRTVLNDFLALRSYFRERGIHLEKHRRLEPVKVIEFELLNKD
jgi:hypothetical protein